MSKRAGRGHGRRSVPSGPHGVRGRRSRRRPGGGGARPRVEVGRRVVRGVVEHGRVGAVGGRGGGRRRRVALLLQAGLGHAQGRGGGEAAGSAENEVENVV